MVMSPLMGDLKLHNDKMYSIASAMLQGLKDVNFLPLSNVEPNKNKLVIIRWQVFLGGKKLSFYRKNISLG